MKDIFKITILSLFLLLTGCWISAEIPNFTSITPTARAYYEQQTGCVHSEPATKCGTLELDMTNGLIEADTQRVQPIVNKQSGKVYLITAEGSYASWDIRDLESVVDNRAFWLEQEIWVTYSPTLFTTSPVMQYDCSVPTDSILNIVDPVSLKVTGMKLINDCVARTTIRMP